jgi:hypothetical protein
MLVTVCIRIRVRVLARVPSRPVQFSPVPSLTVLKLRYLKPQYIYAPAHFFTYRR